MKFIPESVIDQSIEALSVSDSLDEAIKELADAQPFLVAYLSSETTSAFSNEEKDFLFFATSVIVTSVNSVEPAPRLLGLEMLTEIEEQNFTILTETKGKEFRDRITVFFENYPQEDLLAFAEDALEEDEENLITDEGREYLFVMLKTIIDTFHKSLLQK